MLVTVCTMAACTLAEACSTRKMVVTCVVVAPEMCCVHSRNAPPVVIYRKLSTSKGFIIFPFISLIISYYTPTIVERSGLKFFCDSNYFTHFNMFVVLAGRCIQ